MMVKTTLQGGLIYLTMVFFTATLVAFGFKRRTLAKGFWFAGFLAALSSVIWRGIHTGHPPMQNLFEFFLCMAAFLWPLSQLSRWKNDMDTTVKDATLGLIILFPVGFVFSEAVRRLPPALQSPLFVPHVASYVAGYIMLARAALMSLPMFKRSSTKVEIVGADIASRQTVVVGFLLITIGLVLGSLWGKLCWGHYWQWDPKETWSLATWLIYGVYFHLRMKTGLRKPRQLATFLWIGLLFIVLTLTWINLSRMFSGMHNYA
ncbi:MAG: cytochrome c biogenesis protein CcsA [Kiritimatiellae bacterium]|jgi:ABC-type transport system involved in cytochrome c biogenesis permease subunit|nr:cytochrome c biogenesis protein CcsA [Kiritimatiellia bacterium]